MLTQVRTDVEAALTAGDIKALVYTAEQIEPPCAVVVPAQPYLVWAGPDIPFGHVRVRVDVLLLSHIATAKKTAELVDELLVKALQALDEGDIDPAGVSQPGEIEFNRSKFMGTVITIETETRKP